MPSFAALLDTITGPSGPGGDGRQNRHPLMAQPAPGMTMSNSAVTQANFLTLHLRLFSRGDNDKLCVSSSRFYIAYRRLMQ